MSAIPHGEMNTPGDTGSPPAKVRKASLIFKRADFVALTGKVLLAVTGFLGLRGLWDFLSYQPDPSPPTVFDLGPVETYPTSSVTTFAEAHAVLVRQGDVLTAFSTVCPHLGCTVEMDTEGFTCPCHGSRFSSLGELRRGPANKPLRSLKLAIDDQGHLILDTSES